LEERQLVFAYVPKVACTNWKCVLRKASGNTDWLDTELAHDRKRSGLRYLDANVGSDLDILTSQDVKKYAMVRNPYTRILSAYLNKFQGRKGQALLDEGSYFDNLFLELDGWRKGQQLQELTFGVFLRWLRDSRSTHVNNEHFAPQAELLRIDEVSYDFIGRFEAIVSDSAAVLRSMGLEVDFPSQEQVRFPPTRAETMVNEHFGTRDWGLVEEIYSQDLNVFDYSRPVT
jgi:hypothetical protein